MKLKKEIKGKNKEKRTKKVRGELRSHIFFPFPSRDGCDPKTSTRAECQRLKDGLWPFSEWSDGIPSVVDLPAANTYRASTGYLGSNHKTLQANSLTAHRRQTLGGFTTSLL